jgi:hypothetical protein
MDPFSYICIMTSIVLGLAVSRLVAGMAQLLETRRRTPAYWAHSLWMVNTMVTAIIVWWVQYRWRHAEEWSLWLCLWLLVSPITLSFASAVLFPNEIEGEPITDWRQHYYETRHTFFLLIGAIFPLDLIDSLLKGLPYFVSLGRLYLVSMLTMMTLCGLAAFTRSPRYHGAFAILFLAWNLGMLGSNLLRMM